MSLVLRMTGRRANWPSVLWPGTPAPTIAARSVRGGLASLLMALDEIRSIEDTNLVLRRAIELARDRIGLKRAGIFVLDPSRNVMLGTWGMDLSCAVVDEHHVVYDLCETDQEALRRSEDEGVHFTVFENCPIIEHQRGETRVAGRGWVAKTPIRSANTAIGMMFNDAGLTGAPVDEAKQAHAAILCSMLGSMLDPVRGLLGRRAASSGESPGQALVSATVEMLERDPRMGGKEIAAALNMSLSRVARVFKAIKGMSLVEYRNGLRLERFVALVDGGCTNLLEAALDSGFGSYAQFHRVFRARLQSTPREYLRPAGSERGAPGLLNRADLALPGGRARGSSQ